jgi:hypothetical protein
MGFNVQANVLRLVGPRRGIEGLLGSVAKV